MEVLMEASGGSVGISGLGATSSSSCLGNNEAIFSIRQSFKFFMLNEKGFCFRICWMW